MGAKDDSMRLGFSARILPLGTTDQRRPRRPATLSPRRSFLRQTLMEPWPNSMALTRRFPRSRTPSASPTRYHKFGMTTARKSSSPPRRRKSKKTSCQNLPRLPSIATPSTTTPTIPPFNHNQTGSAASASASSSESVCLFSPLSRA